MKNEKIIREYFEGTPFLVPGKSYHSELPPELAEWYCYTADGGHSILVLIEGAFETPDWERLCPAPVKSVLGNYRVVGDFVAAKLNYDPKRGLSVDPSDEEF